MPVCKHCNGSGHVEEPLAVGLALKAHRLACGMTQSEMARRAGMSRAYIWLIERGKANANDQTRAAYASLIEQKAGVIA